VVELKPRPTMFQEKDEGKYSYVAAIEVGTSYSGYAFAPRSKGRLNIKEIGKLAGDGHFLIYIIGLKLKNRDFSLYLNEYTSYLGFRTRPIKLLSYLYHFSTIALHVFCKIKQCVFVASINCTRYHQF